MKHRRRRSQRGPAQHSEQPERFRATAAPTDTRIGKVVQRGELLFGGPAGLRGGVARGETGGAIPAEQRGIPRDLTSGGGRITSLTIASEKQNSPPTHCPVPSPKK